jgi:hypothetical protein
MPTPPTNPTVDLTLGSTLQLVLLLVTAGELGKHHGSHSSLALYLP